MAEWGFYKFGELAKNWPEESPGVPVKPAFLQHVGGVSQLDVDIAVNVLTAFGIPTICTCPNDGDFGKLIIGVPGSGTDVYVPETMLEDARNIISCDMSEEEPQEITEGEK